MRFFLLVVSVDRFLPSSSSSSSSSIFSFLSSRFTSSMKLQSTEFPLGKQQSRRKSPKIFPLILLTFLLTIVTIYYPSLRYHTINPKKVSVLTSSSDSLEGSIKPSAFDDPCPIEDDGSHPCDSTDGGELVSPEETDDSPKGGDSETTKLSENEAPKKGDLEVAEAAWPNRSRGEPVVGRKSERREKKRHGRRRRESKAPPAEEIVRRLPSHDDGRVVESSELIDKEECDLFSGDWVPNPEAPYYTNLTCFAIQEHQNCMKFGRPDTGFLKWRWKPDGCDLPVFEPHQFLELVRGKYLAFVGDSVARNHMQSLICLLSRVALPVTVSNPLDQNQRHEYREYNFTMSIFWAPYLVRVEKTDPNSVNRPFNLYLDEFDEDWRSKIVEYDYVIISGGQWFFRPTNFYLNRRFIGCLYCPEENVTHYSTAAFSYRRAFRTALRAIYSTENFKGLTVLRTYATSHFENGRWDAGGDCARTRPFKTKEAPPMEDYAVDMYNIQLQELQIAQREARKRGLRFRLFDATKPMYLRPDGHPSRYGRRPQQNVTLANDCVHWCLPGPIDTLNDFLLELMRREEKETSFR